MPSIYNSATVAGAVMTANDWSLWLYVAGALGAVGTLLPVILRSVKIDPALAGSVILTTVTDVVGFLSFLGLATLFYA